MSREEAVAAWAAGAALTDGSGMPSTWYHGTDDLSPFNVFARWEDSSLGYHFGSPEAASDRVIELYRMALPGEPCGVVVPVLCRAENPLRLPDLLTWGQAEIAYALEGLGVLNEDESDWLAESASVELVFAVLEEAGYDAVVYENLCEHKAKPTDSIFVWRAELLKSPFASSFDRGDPRLLPQIATDPADIEAWRRTARLIDEEKASLREFRAALRTAVPAA